MKMIIAIVRPHKLHDVKAALSEMGVMGMTVIDARGYGRQRGHIERYRGSEYVVDLLPKVPIEVAVTDEQVSAAVQAIITATRTGEVGDGKIFIMPVDDAVRVRTGDRGDDALY